MIITVKDIKEALSSFPDDTPVYLDKDGWMEEDHRPKDAQDLIYKRGLFYLLKGTKESGPYLLIKN